MQLPRNARTLFWKQVHRAPEVAGRKVDPWLRCDARVGVAWRAVRDAVSLHVVEQPADVVADQFDR